MTIAGRLFQEAEQIALHQQKRALGIEHEIRKLEAELAQKHLALNAARMAYQRLSKFDPQLGANFHCPRCWIENELMTALDPSGGDFVNCKTCGSEFSV